MILKNKNKNQPRPVVIINILLEEFYLSLKGCFTLSMAIGQLDKGF